MSADILTFNGETVLPIDGDRVLDGAKAANLAEVFVVGRHQSGALFMAATHSELGELFMLLERAKQTLMEMQEGSR